MNFLLDTNVLSEVRRPAPERRVIGWLDAVDEDRVFISTASLAELRRGVEIMEAGRRRTALGAWLSHDLPQRFAGRILAIDQAVAMRWGDLMAAGHRRGIALSVMDGFFAATASVHGLTLVTRNVKDFAATGTPLFNPWDEQAP
ncbi:type II toxin-antitoxin system VapC family toxin [Bradyrhizobium sp. HKCCYLS2038]|uniref:type II toxin-antitoxin system VapC family toxin n=1 Tax=unclassified Bradyrhizobium TaxID=2631580 RepID=UPI003EB98555